LAYDTIITGGKVVLPDGIKQVDVAFRGETIAAVGKGLVRRAGETTKIVDATGRYVLPGLLDVHVHLELPFCGTVSSDDYVSGTRAAARSGVTTLIDFAIPYGKDSLRNAMENWMAKADGKACVDYGFHLCITDGKRHIRQMPAMIKRGVPTFKAFMIYESEGWRSNDAVIYAALEQCRDHGGMLMIHAESNDVMSELITRNHNKADMKKYGAQLHAMTRPDYVEAEAIQRGVMWSEATGGPLYIVHMSTGRGADIVREAKKRRVNVYAETCPQYLVLDDSVFAQKDGHLYACCPQVKKQTDSERLWKGLKSGEVSVVGTDTCTFTRKQKAMWKGDFTKIPMGLPGAETMLPVMYTHGVLNKQLTLRQIVKACATNPAKLMGLYPKKGVIRKGSDADIVIIHPKNKVKVDWHKMETNADWNPYQGWRLAGFADKTFCRGKLVVDNYKCIGEKGWGQFQPREKVGRL
jgi:dihydropyrimidinase